MVPSTGADPHRIYPEWIGVAQPDLELFLLLSLVLILVLVLFLLLLLLSYLDGLEIRYRISDCEQQPFRTALQNRLWCGMIWHFCLGLTQNVAGSSWSSDFIRGAFMSHKRSHFSLYGGWCVPEMESTPLKKKKKNLQTRCMMLHGQTDKHKRWAKETKAAN